MPTLALSLFPEAGQVPWPQPGQDHTLCHASWSAGLDSLQLPAFGAPASLVSSHWRIQVYPSPPPTDVQVRMDPVSHHLTQTKRQDPAHPAGSGEPAKCTPRTQKHPEGGGPQPHPEDQETEAKPQSDLLEATQQGLDKSFASPGTGVRIRATTDPD